MDTWLFNSILFFVVGLILLLELRSKSFRRATFGLRPRNIRNWSFFLGAFSSATLMRIASEAMRGPLTPLVDWSEHVVLNAVACLLVAELIGYFLHWIKHKHGWLWRFHFSHHRDDQYGLWMTAHTHVLEVLVSGALMLAILILLGFSSLSLSIYFLFYSIANTYQHSSFDYSLGPLDRLIINPAYHRLHHAVGAHTNFGNTITFWDVMFRTAQWPESRRAPDVKIGVDGPEPYGFAEEMVWFLKPDAPVPTLLADRRS